MNNFLVFFKIRPRVLLDNPALRYPTTAQEKAKKKPQEIHYRLRYVSQMYCDQIF